MEVTVVCDRCKQEVKGLWTESATAGFYSTKSESYWSKYANPEEEVVCDECMWTDDRYIAAYGGRP